MIDAAFNQSDEAQRDECNYVKQGSRDHKPKKKWHFLCRNAMKFILANRSIVNSFWADGLIF